MLWTTKVVVVGWKLGPGFSRFVNLLMFWYVLVPQKKAFNKNQHPKKSSWICKKTGAAKGHAEGTLDLNLCIKSHLCLWKPKFRYSSTRKIMKLHDFHPRIPYHWYEFMTTLAVLSCSTSLKWWKSLPGSDVVLVPRRLLCEVPMDRSDRW